MPSTVICLPTSLDQECAQHSELEQTKRKLVDVLFARAASCAAPRDCGHRSTWCSKCGRSLAFGGPFFWNRRKLSRVKANCQRSPDLVPSVQTLARHHDCWQPDQLFTSFVPGATKAWCDSLPYPYCEEPAPGRLVSGAHPPNVYLVLPRPIFGS